MREEHFEENTFLRGEHIFLVKKLRFEEGRTRVPTVGGATLLLFRVSRESQTQAQKKGLLKKLLMKIPREIILQTILMKEQLPNRAL